VAEAASDPAGLATWCTYGLPSTDVPAGISAFKLYAGPSSGQNPQPLNKFTIFLNRTRCRTFFKMTDLWFDIAVGFVPSNQLALSKWRKFISKPTA
jgi:hypothetical protein